MTAADARTFWREITNRRSTTVVPDATIDLFLDGGQEALNLIAHYFYTTGSVTIVAGTQEYALPSDYLEDVFVEHGGRELAKRDIDDWRRDGIRWREEAQGIPEEYAIYGNKIVFRPTPNAAAVAADSTPDIRYVAKPTAFSSTEFDQLSSQHHRLVVYYAAYLFNASYPDSALAHHRMKSFLDIFNAGAELVAAEYGRRRVQG